MAKHKKHLHITPQGKRELQQLKEDAEREGIVITDLVEAQKLFPHIRADVRAMCAEKAATIEGGSTAEEIGAHYIHTLLKAEVADRERFKN